MPGLADRPSKYSNIYIDVTYIICDHFSSTCGLLGEVDVLVVSCYGCRRYMIAMIVVVVSSK
jgi:hypothetical protein